LPGEAELRAALAAACKVLHAAGVVGDGLAGHLSVRLDDRRILIKPRAVSWQTLKPVDLIVIGMDGARVDSPGLPVGVREWPIHARVYARRPDVHCVLHAHPVDSTLMAAIDIAIEPLDQDCASLAGRVQVLDNGAVSIASPALGDQVAEALGSADALLLKHHGCVIAGSGIAPVGVTAHKLEKVAQTMLRAAGLRPLPVIPGGQQAAILAARKGVESPGMLDERWRLLNDYFLESE
jgi:ribulose-5-phosphate 4-epimerase/fuculose-1-phosphate aldolase